MKKKTSYIFLCVLTVLAASLLPVSTAGGVPGLMNFQGRLTDAEDGSENGEWFRTVRVDPDISQLLDENNATQEDVVRDMRTNLLLKEYFDRMVDQNPEVTDDGSTSVP